MAEKMNETFTEFATVTFVAIVLTYLLLCAMMESWTQPFIILLTVPFSYLGLYIALWLTDESMSMFGLLAGVMLVGVVVNAAILLIDEINIIRRTYGTPKHIALIRAAKRKFRPILMSCVAPPSALAPSAASSSPPSWPSTSSPPPTSSSPAATLNRRTERATSAKNGAAEGRPRRFFHPRGNKS